MKISMVADFYIMKNMGHGEFVVMDESEIEDVSIGGYQFDIGKYQVPFDWEAYEGSFDKEGFYSFTTGRGWFFTNYELDTCYDERYAEMGLRREEITAALLASAHHIDDFYVNFITNGKECEVGSWKVNGDMNAPYHMQLLRVRLEDVDGDKGYEVDQRVIDSFNKGERLLGLDKIMGEAFVKCNENMGLYREKNGKDMDTPIV